MQKARRHHEEAPTACKRMVSGTISPPYSGYFSPFPHGTSSLSVSQEYLALPDGAGRFKRRFHLSPPYSGYLLHHINLPLRGSHPLWLNFPESSCSFIMSYCSPTTPTCRNILVWAIPRSLATTKESLIVFSSSGYLDVSVHRVCSTKFDYLIFK